jgi:hypothetical protein
MISFFKNISNTLRSCYLIEVCFVEINPPGSVPVLVETKYISVYKDGTLAEYVTNPKEATQFSYVMGLLIAKNMQKKLSADTPNLQISMVPVSDAMFIDDVTNAPLSEKTKKLIEVSELLATKLIKNSGVVDVGVVYSMGETPNGHEYIEIRVKNAVSKQNVIDYLKTVDDYKTLPIQVTTFTPQTP